MADPFRTTRRVEFVDTDMAGIVHFSNFFRWMESAEVEFLRARGVDQDSGIAAVDPKWWDNIAAYLKSSGIVTYEQDWLDRIFTYSPAFTSDIGTGELARTGPGDDRNPRRIGKFERLKFSGRCRPRRIRHTLCNPVS